MITLHFQNQWEQKSPKHKPLIPVILLLQAKQRDAALLKYNPSECLSAVDRGALTSAGDSPTTSAAMDQTQTSVLQPILQLYQWRILP